MKGRKYEAGVAWNTRESHLCQGSPPQGAQTDRDRHLVGEIVQDRLVPGPQPSREMWGLWELALSSECL